MRKFAHFLTCSFALIHEIDYKLDGGDSKVEYFWKYATKALILLNVPVAQLDRAGAF